MSVIMFLDFVPAGCSETINLSLYFKSLNLSWDDANTRTLNYFSDF